MFFKRFVIACFVLCAFFWCAVSFPARADVTVGESAPPLVAKALDGSTVDLARLRGRMVIVSLWDTTCASCVRDLKTLRDFYNTYEDKGLAVVALSVDPKKLIYAVRNIEATVDYPVVMATDARENGFAAPRNLPVFYVIGRNGDVRGIYTALPSVQQLYKAVF